MPQEGRADSIDDVYAKCSGALCAVSRYTNDGVRILFLTSARQEHQR